MTSLLQKPAVLKNEDLNGVSPVIVDDKIETKSQCKTYIVCKLLFFNSTSLQWVIITLFYH